MRIWIQTEQSVCDPADRSRWALEFQIGISPAEPGQAVSLQYVIEGVDSSSSTGYLDAAWTRTEGNDSFWFVRLPDLAAGDRIRYLVVARSRCDIRASGSYASFVGPRLFVALLWHQHQPSYRNYLHQEPSVLHFPWVRLHALRDYYSMAALVRNFPRLHLTINLTPVLIDQLQDYVTGRCSDPALELTRKATDTLTAEERGRIVQDFFTIDWHDGSSPSGRFGELAAKKRSGDVFAPQDITDLRMWFNLAWFAPEFREGSVMLPDGREASVRRFVEQERGFSETDILSMLQEQHKILANVIAIHRELQDSGRIEVTTSPYFHPILPLLHDSDRAIMDRPGCTLPLRYFYPEDAQAQVELAAEHYRKIFGRRPRGMWPPEGAVGESILTHFEKSEVAWIASDQGVLRISGEWGFDTSRPEVLGRAWCATAEDLRKGIAIFFRDTELSDDIGFHYSKMDPYEAARQFVDKLKSKYLAGAAEERIVSVILDGENAWGWYPSAGRLFLKALYQRLSEDPDVCTVTFGEYLEGNVARGIPAHRVDSLWRVDKLAHASWIDERGSAPGNDLGTWIGEPEENRAWDLLRMTRDELKRHGITRHTHPEAFAALYAAEGSDWFWWYGDNQECAHEPDFDHLFRQHMQNAYRLAGLEVPALLAEPILPHVITWTPLSPVEKITTHERLRIQSPLAGVVRLRTSFAEDQLLELGARGGAMTDGHSYSVVLPPWEPPAIEFRFEGPAAEANPDGEGWYRVAVEPTEGARAQ